MLKKNIMKLKMRNGNVALKMLSPDERTVSGLYMPQNMTQGHLRIGQILCSGKGELVQGIFVASDLEKDQNVIFDSSRAEGIEFDGETVFICNMIDIIATLD